MSETSIDPTPDQIRQLADSKDTGPIVMVNLIRFKEEADGIDEGVSGAEAYGRYGRAVVPFLEKVGGKPLIAVNCEQSVIGPQEAEWDLVLMVEYPSRQAFLDMVSDPGYQEIHAHREAAVADSRLILSSPA